MTSETRVQKLRAFNRFYTQILGLLGDKFLDSPFSLTEGRILFELAVGDATSPTALAGRLGLHAGYVSRVLSRLKDRGLVRADASQDDGRRQILSLTRRGLQAFRALDERSSQQIRDLLSTLSDDEQRHLMTAVTDVQRLLGKRGRSLITLRAPLPGDFGWVVSRHGDLYAREYGWDETCEGFIAEIVARYLEGRDPEREAAWIAEVDGDRVGCIFCMKKNDTVAQLRLLLVEPTARGLGLGSRLVRECIRFARDTGYKQLMLWTNDVLVDARRIYEREGFRLVEEEPHHSFGQELVGQNWSLDL